MRLLLLLLSLRATLGLPCDVGMLLFTGNGSCTPCTVIRGWLRGL